MPADAQRDVTTWPLRLQQFPASGQGSTCESLLTMLAGSSPKVYEHSVRVASCALFIGQQIGLDPVQLDHLHTAGILHDVGKALIPCEVLDKAGPLSPGEWRLMKYHPSFGELLANMADAPSEVCQAIRHHHERWDGTGYPDGLERQRTPLLARILAVADAFDAMCESRPYRTGLTEEEARAELRRVAGTQLDPALVNAFLKRTPAER